MKTKSGATALLLVDAAGNKDYAAMKVKDPESGKTVIEYRGKRYVWLGEVNPAGFLVMVETNA